MAGGNIYHSAAAQSLEDRQREFIIIEVFVPAKQGGDGEARCAGEWVKDQLGICAGGIGQRLGSYFKESLVTDCPSTVDPANGVLRALRPSTPPLAKPPGKWLGAAPCARQDALEEKEPQWQVAKCKNASRWEAGQAAQRLASKQWEAAVREESRHAAAVTIQCLWRKRLALQKRLELQRVAAAVRVQLWWRRHRAQ